MRVRSTAPPPVIFSFQNCDRDVKSTLRPALGDDCAAQSGFQVYPEITLTGVADVTLALTCSERRVLDMCGKNEVWRERCEGGIRDLGLARAAAREADGSNSRYEEPEAVGIRPVLRTCTVFVSRDHHQLQEKSLSRHTYFP